MHPGSRGEHGHEVVVNAKLAQAAMAQAPWRCPRQSRVVIAACAQDQNLIVWMNDTVRPRPAQ